MYQNNVKKEITKKLFKIELLLFILAAIRRYVIFEYNFEDYMLNLLSKEVVNEILY